MTCNAFERTWWWRLVRTGMIVVSSIFIKHKFTIILIFSVFIIFNSSREFFELTNVYHDYKSGLLKNDCQLSFAGVPKAVQKPFNPWHDFTHPQLFKHMVYNVSDYSIYNPSLIYSDKFLIFVARYSWTPDIRCSSLKDFNSIRRCNSKNPSRWGDSTIFGIATKKTCNLKVDMVTSHVFVNLDWDGGLPWVDTKIFSLPYYIDQKRTGFWITSMKSEILDVVDWHIKHKNIFAFVQLVFIGYIPLGTKVKKKTNLVRAFYYNPDPTHWTFKDTQFWFDGLQYTIVEMARGLCRPRPADLPPLPNITYRKPFLQEQYSAKPNENGKFVMTQYGGEWMTGKVQEKNWAPFVYNDNMYWSHTIEPHIVCQMDIDLRLHDVDCVICEMQFASSNYNMFVDYRSEILNKHIPKESPFKSPHLKDFDWRFHLNGVPAYFVPAVGAYIGVAHIILSGTLSDDKVVSARHERYEHFFYEMEPGPPFRITRLSRPIPLASDVSWAYFNPFDQVVDVAFVSGFQFLPYGRDKSGFGATASASLLREVKVDSFLISYGVGNRYSRVAIMTVSEVMASFLAW